MSLAKLLAKKTLTILGLNSGTSADGLDLAVLRISGSGARQTIRFIDGHSSRYPAAIRQEVLGAVDSGRVALDQFIRLDNLLGQFFGREAAKYLKRLQSRGIVVDAVASHGQTIYHLPQKTQLAGFTVSGTLQLGSLEQIGAHTGKVTVGDFRQADVALGNEGAPITVAAMHRLFSHPKESRLILNIGGMANFFYFPAGGRADTILATDTGPGNSLSDLLSQQLFGEPFDRNGRRAASGVGSKRLLSWVLGMPFFRGDRVSTGREIFGAKLANRVAVEGRRLGLTPEDILATAVEITTQSVCLKLQPILTRDASIKKLYLTGGGLRNRLMRERLAQALAPVKIGSVAELGFGPLLVEASAYAVMGAACLRSEPMATRFIGARQDIVPILGKIVQPPVYR